MATEVRFSVMSPEAGIQKSTGGPPPFMGGPPPGPGGPPPGAGGPPPGRDGPPPGMGEPEPSPPTFTKRLDTLENKTVYMVDIGFGGGYNFMLQLQKWFTENMPSVTTIVKRKPGQVFMDDRNDLWEEVKEKGHAVVLGVAG
jgi:hypothetical protein